MNEVVNRFIYELKPHPRNYNKHSDTQVDDLALSLKRFGQRKPIVTWRDMIVAGHGLTMAAQMAGWTTILTMPIPDDWDEATVLAYLAADNELARQADPDLAQLAAIAKELEGIDEELAMLAAGGDDALKALMATMEEEKPAGDAEPQIDKAEELREKWSVESGQMWRLPSRDGKGEHRLICGDCTDRMVVERVMGGEKANLLLTDPPYGVSYADKNKWLNTVAKGNRIQTPIENDHRDIAETAKELWLPSFSCAFEYCCDTASFYLFMPQGGDQMMMMMMMNEAGWMPRHELIWLKNNHVLGRADYNYKHEPILYGWKRKGTHKFYGDFQTSVIECNRPQSSDLHPTMKPVELIERLIPNNTLPNEIILEPFSGSGTTIIACENLSRKCRAVEISPAYVAVALQRYLDAFGITPELIHD